MLLASVLTTIPSHFMDANMVDLELRTRRYFRLLTATPALSLLVKTPVIKWRYVLKHKQMGRKAIASTNTTPLSLGTSICSLSCFCQRPEIATNHHVYQLTTMKYSSIGNTRPSANRESSRIQPWFQPNSPGLQSLLCQTRI